jgi:D-alanyl-D-alanine carboxypeptidase (penicillin-binding protein 5/6)
MQKIFNLCFLFLFLITPLEEATAAPKKTVKKEVIKKGQNKPKETKTSAAKESSAKAEFPSTKGVPEIEVKAKQAILVEDQTGIVLLQRNADELMHPSSMTKIMTVILVIEKIKAGIIKPETLITVGKEGWRVEGSSMYLNLNDQVSVLELLKGVIIQSGNDASIVLAHNLSGSETAFAFEMTRRAHELGATHTTFKNATGLPHPEHQTTARDLVILSKHAIHYHPDYYKLYSEKSFTYGKITQGNRNPLLYKNMGCDGVKTGHSDIAGYGMVASCIHEGTRYILVINGLPSMQARANEAANLMNWAMHTFSNYTIFKAQELVDEIPVWYGHENTLPITVEKDAVITLARLGRKDLKVKLIYQSPIAAPIQQGSVVGKIVVTSSTLPQPIEFPLIAAITIEESGFFKRLKDSFTYLIWGVPHE